VPRTVAALWRPVVRKFPLPLPHSHETTLLERFFAADAVAWSERVPAFRGLEPQTFWRLGLCSLMSVIGRFALFWRI
jgi:hypothetical protein